MLYARRPRSTPPIVERAREVAGLEHRVAAREFRIQRWLHPGNNHVVYLLACLVCDPPLPMPFASEAERGKWAAAHRNGTGHDKWRVWEERDDGPEAPA